MKYIASFLFLLSLSWGVSQTFKSGVYQNLLIELYSSQGCSSCPPADQWMSEFKNNKELFSKLFPLAFHVDYWDYIGWKDSFGRKKYSQRQRNYAYIGNARQVYTPGFFMNTKEWRGWFSGKSFDVIPTKVGNLEVLRQDNQLIISYAGRADRVHMALLGFNQKSVITRGENRSRTLNHDFIVLNYQTEAFNHKGTFQLNSLKKEDRLALVVWVTVNGEQDFLQVTGGYLD